jgi:hypothetical protein
MRLCVPHGALIGIERPPDVVVVPELQIAANRLNRVSLPLTSPGAHELEADHLCAKAPGVSHILPGLCCDALGAPY